MTKITKEEAEIIRLELGDQVTIATTCKQKKAKRKKYYMEENRESLKLLKRIRSGNYRGLKNGRFS